MLAVGGTPHANFIGGNLGHRAVSGGGEDAVWVMHPVFYWVTCAAASDWRANAGGGEVEVAEGRRAASGCINPIDVGLVEGFCLGFLFSHPADAGEGGVTLRCLQL